ncbi:MAG: hypothetical protein BWK68_00225 [Elusimicrobia bacterium A5]|nr:MAG: hypothetical protein BWK68_00225 [Elusimicrobia bacterium A5]
MEKKYRDSSIKKYLDDLSAKLPAPGGGSAAALVSTTGVSCLLMVANFTVDNKGYEQYQKKIKKILSKLSTFKLQLSTLVDEDVNVCTTLSSAYKTKDREKIQNALKNAISVPCKIFEISLEAIPLAGQLSAIGNKNLISDVACGVSFLRAGIESAKFNIDINLKFVDDAEFVKKTKAKYEKMLKIASGDIEKIIKEAMERI